MWDGLPRRRSGKESAWQCRRLKRRRLDPWVGKIPSRREWQPTPVFLPGISHGRRSLVGCSPLGREESDTTERLHFHFSLSCIGEGNGNPLQCSCLENPRDGGAWWATVYGVAQSRTRLKRLSSSKKHLNWVSLPLAAFVLVAGFFFFPFSDMTENVLCSRTHWSMDSCNSLGRLLQPHSFSHFWFLTGAVVHSP